MKIYLAIDSNKRVVGWGDRAPGVEIEVADNHEIIHNPYIYKYEDGALFKDVAYQQQLVKELKGGA
ncbi:hypothetical protein [Cytobacillus sp. FSL R5-0596]|uniref:hypothetical protein n=1 Tax=Cytobacillus sp. FSL R5-0596 TaxID=2954696 RepID=UPI0030FBDC57